MNDNAELRELACELSTVGGTMAVDGWRRDIAVRGVAAGERAIVVAEDDHFGYHRRGNVELQRRLGPAAGFEDEPIGLVPRTDGVDEPMLHTQRITLTRTPADDPGGERLVLDFAGTSSQAKGPIEE